MKVREYEVPEEAFQVACGLLSQLMATPEKRIKSAIDNQTYRTVFVSKGFGKGQRRLDIPNDELRAVQKRLLKSCLYHAGGCWSVEDWHALKGFKRRQSILDNIKPHLASHAFFQLDFADAFPSVTTEMLRDTLEVLFEEATIRRMFRFKDVRWFRKAFLRSKAGLQLSFGWFSEPINVLWALREIIIMLTVFEGRLPQGAPTSPHLFNMTLEYQGVATLIKQRLEEFHRPEPFIVTIYADNITISTVAESIPEEIRTAIADVISKETSFRIKPDKTNYWVLKNGSHEITGLSIGLKHGKPFATIPQVLQRRVRGLLNRALFSKELRSHALGMVAFLRHIYGGELPRQLAGPYEQLTAAMD